MNLHADLQRLEIPCQGPGIGVELHGNGARCVHLCVLRHHIRLEDVVNPGDFADLLVKRHQGESKAEHCHRNDEQLPKHHAIRLICAHCQCLIMKPIKNAAAAESRTSAVLNLSLCETGSSCRIVAGLCFPYFTNGGVSKL